MATINLTEENFNQTIENNDIVLVDFWATWCAPCRAFGPIFEKASEKHEGVVFGKINTEEQQALAAAFNIRSIPTLMVFRDKVLVFAQPGMLPGNVLDELIGKVRELDMNEIRAKIAEEEKKTESHAAPPPPN
ncbi:MAG: thioredoxin [Coriobacteriia bacterium]|jgi:thioredoxin 1/thioredoxin 2|nr:thioredoxin [Coriobacteriia bacterium]